MKEKLRKYWPTILALGIALAVFLPSVVWGADTPKETTPEGNWLTNIVVVAVSGIVQILISLFGKLTVQLIHILILVAGYNGYMESPVITTGWVIVRDIANLFIVGIILIVSIGSIVSPERFGGAKQVFRILLYALFINFSRTIAGFFIDISQLIMLTFVNGFAQAAGGNFVEALGVTKLTDVQAGTGSAAGLSFVSTMAGLFLALIMFIIITVIIAVMTVALVVRMVTLWLLVVISPLAFALGSSDLTKAHYAEWWKKFSAELTTGPIVAFFLWLSLITFQSTDGSNLTGQKLQDIPAGAKEPVSVSCGETESCSEENMIRFIVATVMLLAGLGFAKDFSGLGGSLAGSALAKGKQYASGAGRWAARKTWGGTKAVGKAGMELSGAGAGIRLAGDKFSQVKRRAGAAIGQASSLPIVGAAFRASGSALTGSAARRDAEALKTARAKTEYYTPEMQASALRDFASSDAEKKAVAMGLSREKVYKEAKPGTSEYDDFAESYKFLDQAGKRGDKDSKDRAKEIKEARPDIVAAAKGEPGALIEAAQKAKLEDLKKIDFESMGEENRNKFFAAMDPSVLATFREKGSSSEEKGYIDTFLGAEALRGPDLQASIARGDNISNQPAVLIGPGTERKPNIDLAVEVVVRGNDAQINQLAKHPNASALRAGLKEDLTKTVDYTVLGEGGGFNAANTRLDDINLRKAEAATIMGANIGDIYGVRNNGDFADERGEQSFIESLTNSPKRIKVLLSLDKSKISADQNTGQANDYTRAVVGSIKPADIKTILDQAKTAEEVDVVQKILKATMNIAGAPGNSALKMHADSVAVATLNDPRGTRLVA